MTAEPAPAPLPAGKPRLEPFRLVTGAAAVPRAGLLATAHGVVRTPAFMPVGTAGSVKGLSPVEIRTAGTQILLANTYHLMLRPGSELIRELGGLHVFMGWDGAILTDSGGYQIVSLKDRVAITEEGVAFRSHLDGHAEFLSPERAMEIQADLGPDIAVTLDHAVPLPAEPGQVREAAERTLRWTERSLKRAERLATPTGLPQLRFAIVQGGDDPALRAEMAERTSRLWCDGFALGGLSLGETKEETWAAARAAIEALPVNRPRYLMGMGTPEDLLDGIAQGVDLFDCVLPTRNARNGMAFTSAGTLNIRNAEHTRSALPLDPRCSCEACARFSRAYLRHLHQAGEILAHRMLTLHNVTFYQTLMAEAREAIDRGAFDAFGREFRRRYREFPGGAAPR
ncbi:MAG TPA: tRNA guanosine(34) transglycosylase Tgt [Candidatus Limnocylindrales bacterium]|nr:tRNA guanosine(34) transglycosylase Tgt [Candidatus Limnocylindrales bacterium]